MADRQIFLVPASNEQAYSHLVETVIEGVSRDRLASPPEDSDETVHVWGTKEKVAEQQSFNRGDVLLFYTGDKTYTQAAVIQETTIDEATARKLWGFDDTDSTQDSETWRHLLYLHPPIEVEIDGGKIADFAEYGLDYVLGFQPLNELGHERILDEYGGIPEFIAKHAVTMSPTEVYNQSLLRRATSKTGEQDSTSDSDMAADSRGGLAASSAWQARCDELASLFEHHKQVVLHGPPHAVSMGQAHRLATRVLDTHDRDPTNRIISVSVDAETTYEDFVERSLSYVEATDSVTATNGPFKRACRLAEAAKNEAEYEGDPVPEFILLVDAAPGVALTDVLGQLGHVLDPSLRRREPTLQLPHSGETLTVPTNLNVLVVRNYTAETQLPRSLRDRFRVVDIPVDTGLLGEIYGYESVDAAKQSFASDEAPIPAATVVTLDALNRRGDRSSEGSSLGPDLFIDYSGEATDTTPGQYPAEVLRDIWQYTALPTIKSLLAESDNPSDSLLEALQAETFGPGQVEDPRELLDAIQDSAAVRSDPSTD